MPKVDKSERREQNNFKERYGMKMSGRSLKTVILPLLGRMPKKKKKK